MEQFISSASLTTHIKPLYSEGKTIGFVPTMGALHEGHLDLVRRAREESDIVICSIFVNPLQFNRKDDFDAYPDQKQADLILLRNIGCDIVFMPTKEDLFSVEPMLEFDFGSLGKNMEAEYRPGHFEGVAAVVARFFELVKPTRAYFGEKDYQQLAIIKWLVNKMQYSTEVVACRTSRDEFGLALSSRNLLLTKSEIERASEIYQTLLYCKSNMEYYKPDLLAKRCYLKLEKYFQPEYFVIADENSLVPLKNWSDSGRPRAFVSAYLSNVRLIDNLSLNP